MLLLGFASAVLFVHGIQGKSEPNDWPVIGVLIQEYTPLNNSYIPSSYVKFVEAAGARAVPIHINRDSAYYQNILPQINGVLFPGGDVDVHTSGYGKAGQIIFDYAVRANLHNDYFPIWGTCNGFEMLSYLSVGRNVLTDCAAMNDPRPLIFTSAANSSRLFGNLQPNIRSHLTEEKTTANFHESCLTMENYTLYGINQIFDVLSTNFDSNGLEYISTMEARYFPFYGVQFHPEKPIYEWVTAVGHSNIPHSKAAIEVGQFFAQFFVNEARKSKHSMPLDVFRRESIYNYPVNYTGDSTVFMQMYFFDE